MAGGRRANGEGSISWDASVQRWVGRLPRDARGRRRKVTGRTKREALAKLRRALRDREDGLAVDGSQLTVGAFLQSWVRDTVEVSGLAASTVAKHEIAVRVHLVPALGRIKLGKLAPAHVQRFIRDELAAGKGPRTVQLSHRTLRQALGQAERWGLVRRNVAQLVTPPRYRPSERRPFTVDEQHRILDAAKGDRFYVAVVVVHACGLRQSELLGLRWIDVDLERRVLRTRVQYGRDGRLRETKTSAGVRSVPLPRVAADVLRTHRADQQRERAAAGPLWDDWGLVLTTRQGRPVSHHNARRSWNRILDQAGVDLRGIHHMRHTYVTMLAERGVHQRTAQQLAGHSDSRMTQEVYTHVTDPMFDAAAEAIDRVISDVVGSSNGSNEDDGDDSAADDDEGAGR